MCFLCYDVLSELTTTKRTEETWAVWLLQGFHWLMPGKRCKSPGTAMTCLNRMPGKGAYKDRLGTLKSDLHEESVRGLCSVVHNAEAPLICCPGWLAVTARHMQLAHFPRHSIYFAMFLKISTVVLQCFKCYTTEKQMMNKGKITHRWSCKTLRN